MVERITKIELQAFRGVPDTFTMELPGGRGCAVLGDNGTGKSSIADAIEWYFKGHIEFLRKEGRSDAIRHSGADEDLTTMVSISTDGSLGGFVTTDTAPRHAVLEAGRSELFMLRGRTLAEFVDKTKAEKWQALAELLGLDAINQFRLDLQHARNALEAVSNTAAGELTRRYSSLGDLVEEVSQSEVLRAFEKKCTSAGVQVPEPFEMALTPEWIKAIVPRGSNDERVVTLKAALADLKVMGDHAIHLEPVSSWNQFVNAGRRDVLPLNLYRAADSLLGSTSERSDLCPLCGQVVESEALGKRVAEALQDLESTDRELNGERRRIRKLIAKLHSGDETLSRIAQMVRRQGVELSESPCSPQAELRQNVEAVTQISGSALEHYRGEVSTWVTEAIKAVEAELPVPASMREQVLVDIGILHTQALEWQSAVRSNDRAYAAFRLCDRVFDQYQLQ